jgi:hypothetical protein
VRARFVRIAVAVFDSRWGHISNFVGPPGGGLGPAEGSLAAAWMLMLDPENESRFVEWFFLESWNEHRRQHGRWTKYDEELWMRARALVAEGTEPRVSHFLQTARPVSSESR